MKQVLLLSSFALFRKVVSECTWVDDKVDVIKECHVPVIDEDNLEGLCDRVQAASVAFRECAEDLCEQSCLENTGLANIIDYNTVGLEFGIRINQEVICEETVVTHPCRVESNIISGASPATYFLPITMVFTAFATSALLG